MSLRIKTIHLAYARKDLRPLLLSVLASTEMPLPKFWKLIREIGWGTQTTDYRKVKAQILKNWPPEQAAAFNATLDLLVNRLSGAVEKWEREKKQQLGIGDDSYDDLLAHIVGLGAPIYQKSLRNPALVAARARADDFTESFHYCIPRAADYKLLDPMAFAPRAQEAKSLLEWLLKNPALNPSTDLVMTLLNGLDQLVKGNTTRFLQMSPPINSAAKTFHQWLTGMDADRISRFYAALKKNPAPYMDPGRLKDWLQNTTHDIEDQHV